MRKYRFYTLCTLFLLAMAGCSDDSPAKDGPEPAPDPDPEVPTPPVEDPDALYNGIVLPDQWPPRRSYSSDIRAGMSPFYLTDRPELVNISVGRQLFVDDFLIESTTLQRQFHYPEYYAGNPVLSPDKDWERTGTAGAAFAAPFSDGVWYDEDDKKFKMWYMAGGGDYAQGGTGVTCYAESADGIHWTKPALNVEPGTNIVDLGSVRDASVVWLDKQETNASERYKMFQVAGGAGNWQYHYKTSADGLTWRDKMAPSGSIADRSTVYKNPFRDVWVWSMRHNVRLNAGDPYTIRARDYYEASDPLSNRNVKADLQYFWFGPWPDEQTHPYYHNNDGSPGIYNLDATPYESLMLGFFSVWQGPENDVCASDNVLKRNQIMVGYSRDGYSWLREDMNPFLPVDEDRAAWNNGNLQSVAGTPLIVDDQLYFYLSGRRLEGRQEITTTGLATLRRDGFASMSGSGELQTPLLKFSGQYFFVNANVTGSLLVELLDEEGKVIDGFAKADCAAVKGDGTKLRVEWKDNPTLASLEGKNIKIKFYLDDGDIYAFWISPEQTGESHGYTGGGGPGLDRSGMDINN